MGSLEGINSSCSAQQLQLDEEKKTLLKIEESLGKTKVIKAEKEDIVPATVVVTGPPAVEQKNTWKKNEGMTIPKATDGSNFLKACSDNGGKDIRSVETAQELCKGECASSDNCAAVVVSPKGAWMMKSTKGMTENADNFVLQLV